MIETFTDVVDIITKIAEIGDNWHDNQNISGPDSDCIKSVYNIIRKLYDDYGILPQYVKQSFEGGLLLQFYKIGKHVIMEMYNDGDCTIVFKSDSLLRDSIVLSEEEGERLSPQIIYLMLKS